MVQRHDFGLNGASVSVQAQPGQSLLDVLRNTLGLRATRMGCGQGQCGACRVMIDAGLDAEGRIVEWTQTVWSQGHGTRPGRGKTPALLGAWQTAQPVTMAVNAAMAVGGGSERNVHTPTTSPPCAWSTTVS